jgi:3-oxoacyl-[acyl-carrier protein] reductase
MRRAVLDKLTAPGPLKRLGQAEAIAHAVLLMFENDFFTGRCLDVDGGLRR